MVKLIEALLVKEVFCRWHQTPRVAMSFAHSMLALWTAAAIAHMVSCVRFMVEISNEKQVAYKEM